MKTPSNFIELFLVEWNLSMDSFAKQVGMKRTTLMYKVRNKRNQELIHTLSYAEYVAIENKIQEYENEQ